MIKKILVLVVAILFMSTCLFLSLKSYLTYKEDYVSVYVASHQIGQRTLISEIDLSEMKLPKQIINDDIYTGLEDIEGKYVKLGYSIPKGSLIYRTALESDIKDLANTLLFDKQVSYDLYTNEIRINPNTLSENMYIDIYLTINNSNKALSDLLIKDCRIIGIYDNNGQRILSFDQFSKVAIISIAIEEDEVVVLNKALKIGEVSGIITNNTYQSDIRSKLNEESELYEYLK